MRSKPWSACLCLLLIACAELSAQADSPVVAHVRFISTTQPLLGVGVVTNRKPQAVTIPTDMFSQEIIYRGPGRLELLRLNVVKKDAAKTPESEPLPAPSPAPRRGVKALPENVAYVVSGSPPIAWIDLPRNQGALHLIILVTPGRGNGMVMLNDRPGSFPPGSNRYLNLCSFPLTVRTPSGDYVVAAGNSQVLRPGALDKTYYDLQLLSRDAKVVFSTRAYHLESERKLYVLGQVGTTDRIQLKAIVDRPQPPRVAPVAEAGKK
jgi:hypothetical protein